MLARAGQLGAALRVSDQSERECFDPSEILEAMERGLWSRALPCAGIRIGARCQRAVWAVTVNPKTCLPIELALPPGSSSSGHAAFGGRRQNSASAAPFRGKQQRTRHEKRTVMNNLAQFRRETRSRESSGSARRDVCGECIPIWQATSCPPRARTQDQLSAD
jgi:hypothetical protein